jgi:hypothetical protein
MPENYEKDGIIYFNTPYAIEYQNWIGEHLDCDSIITKESVNESKVCIICYASKEKYNEALRQLRDKKYPSHIIMQGLGHEEVNCID